jgi:hypothetical protein
MRCVLASSTMKAEGRIRQSLILLTKYLIRTMAKALILKTSVNHGDTASTAKNQGLA